MWFEPGTPRLYLFAAGGGAGALPQLSARSLHSPAMPRVPFTESEALTLALRAASRGAAAAATVAAGGSGHGAAGGFDGEGASGAHGGGTPFLGDGGGPALLVQACAAPLLVLTYAGACLAVGVVDAGGGGGGVAPAPAAARLPTPPAWFVDGVPPGAPMRVEYVQAKQVRACAGA
jgi:hypothetical protein